MKHQRAKPAALFSGCRFCYFKDNEPLSTLSGVDLSSYEGREQAAFLIKSRAVLFLLRFAARAGFSDLFFAADSGV